jgi:hypothetical protein
VGWAVLVEVVDLVLDVEVIMLWVLVGAPLASTQ